MSRNRVFNQEEREREARQLESAARHYRSFAGIDRNMWARLDTANRMQAYADHVRDHGTYPCYRGMTPNEDASSHAWGRYCAKAYSGGQDG